MCNYSVELSIQKSQQSSLIGCVYSVVLSSIRLMFFTSLVVKRACVVKYQQNLLAMYFHFFPSSWNNSKLPSFSWYYKEWKDGIPELGEVKKPTKSKAGQRCKREVQVSNLSALNSYQKFIQGKRTTECGHGRDWTENKKITLHAGWVLEWPRNHMEFHLWDFEREESSKAGHGKEKTTLD